ncbi:MAG: hypothetical protein I8H66_11480 [Sphingobacteriia bacterium]|nr:hypothetical protein [Sphingobacteriia bacterium]
MKKFLLLLCLLRFCIILNAQGNYSLIVSSDRMFYCTQDQVAKVNGQVNSISSTYFTGVKFHFYYYISGFYQEIGYYSVSTSGGTIFSNYSNIQPLYFDGSKIANPQQHAGGGSVLWIGIDVPYSAFPNNNTGQQLVVDIEGIDQYGSTTTHSSKLHFSVPLLYSNPVVLNSATITADATILCGGGSALLSGAPNMVPYGFRYDWYRDGTAIALSDASGSLSINRPGSYYAIVSDVCQSATTNSILISSGNLPGKPVVNSSSGTLLCNGASTTLTASPTAGGIIYWNTGETGTSISVSAAGDYFCWEINGCRQGPSSDAISISTGSTPATPSITSSAGDLLCNGSNTTLTASGLAGTVTWNTGQTGNAITVSSGGAFFAYQSNSCGTSGNSNTISVSTGTTPATLNISSSNGTLLCNGASTTLIASGIEGAVTWNKGQTGNSVTISASGDYYAYQTNSCGTSANSNTLAISTGSTPGTPSISSSNGILLCNGGTTLLSASGIDGTVNWSTGQTGSSISVSSAGTYYANQTNSCGTTANSNTLSISTLVTAAAPMVTSSNGTYLCNGASTVLSTAPSYGGFIRWNTGQTGNTITVTAGGTYYAWEQNECGNSANSNSVIITTGNVPAAPTVSPGNNQLLCNGASATLTATGTNITWSTGNTGNSFTATSAGTYYAYDQNGCGNSSFSNQVVIATGNCPIPVPGTIYTICPGTLKTLDAGGGFESYLWSNGANTQTISVGPGTYSVTVMKNGCYASSAVVTVNSYSVTDPTITASSPTSFCSGGSVILSASLGTAYLWNTGATGSSINVTSAGNYSVTVTDNNGCQVNSSSVATMITPLPSATITGSTAVCQGSGSPMISLSGSGGSAPYTFTYRINGGTAQSVSTSSGNSVSIAVPTSTAGSYSYSLVSIQESSSTGCAGSASGVATVLVNPLPVASISGTTAVCQNATAPQISFTGSNGSAPYTFVYRVNGGSAQTITTASGNSVSIAVPTGSAGDYIYSLVSVSDASTTSCSNTASGSATITVNPLPTASLSGNALVCQNGTEPVISFTGGNGTAPYTFTYAINGGSQQSISTSSGNSVSISVPTSVAGNFNYQLISVRDASGTTCSNAVNGSVTITVNPLPSATISGSGIVCQNSGSPAIQFTGSGGTAPYTFVYQVNGGATQSVSTASGSTVKIDVSTATPGDYTYTLVGVSDGSSTNCANVASGSATITVNSIPSASISGETTVCQNTNSPQINFTGSGGTAPYTFTYRINGSANQTITTTTGNSIALSVPAQAAGSFTYSLISVQDGSTTTCTNAAVGAVTVTVYPQPDAAVITSSESHLCNGSSAVLRILNYVSGNTYEWHYNQSVLKTSLNDTIINENAGVFTVRAISGQGCRAASNSNEIKITTGSVTTPVILGARKVCEGGKTELVVNSQGKPFELWRWSDPPDLGHPRQIYSWDSHFFAEAGQYQVWVMREGCFDSSLVTVTADDTEYPAGELMINPSTVPYGGAVQLKAAITNAGVFLWDFGDGTKLIIKDSVVTQYYYKAADSLLVQVDAVSPRNCITHFSRWLRVLPEPAAPKREAFVRGNLKDWNVFPIPFEDHLQVSVILKRKQEVRIELFTGEGKRVKSWIKAGIEGENLFQLEGVEQLSRRVVYFITAIYNNEKHFDKVYKN